MITLKFGPFFRLAESIEGSLLSLLAKLEASQIGVELVKIFKFAKMSNDLSDGEML